jgi:hypothetical protein
MRVDHRQRALPDRSGGSEDRDAFHDAVARSQLPVASSPPSAPFPLETGNWKLDTTPVVRLK